MFPFTRHYRRNPPIVLVLNGVAHGVSLPERRPGGRPRKVKAHVVPPDPPPATEPSSPWRDLIRTVLTDPFVSRARLATAIGIDEPMLTLMEQGESIPDRSTALLLLQASRYPYLFVSQMETRISQWAAQEELPPIQPPLLAPLNRQLSRREKRELVLACLREQPDVSSRQLGRQLGVSNRYVAMLKKMEQEARV